MKTTTLALCLFVCTLLPALHCRAEDAKQALSVEFVSADTDGNLHVKFVNKTDTPLIISALDEADLSADLRVISIDRLGKTLPYLWKKRLQAGSHLSKYITVAAQGSIDWKFNIYGIEWLFGEQGSFSAIPSKTSPETTFKSLYEGDEVVILYQGKWTQGNDDYRARSATLLCYGKVSAAPKPKPN